MRYLNTILIFILTLATVSAISGGGGVGPGTGAQPIVEYMWVLPDESIEAGTQLEIVPGGERNDIYACIIVSDEDSRDSIADVFVDAFHPDDSFKYQVHANLYDPYEDEDLARSECIVPALNAGLITSEEASEIQGSIPYNIFSQQNWHIYKVSLPMLYHQPAGTYTLKGYAVDTWSSLSEAYEENFEWLAGTYLELDFANLNFGNIQPGFWKVINGDLQMDTSNAPTLKNEGNTEVKVGLEFSKYIGKEHHKVIDDFNAQLRNLGARNYLGIPGQHIEFKADNTVWFDNPISLCRQEKIDFSIHANIGTVPDDYEGTLTVYVQPNVVSNPPEGYEQIGCFEDSDCSNNKVCELYPGKSYGECLNPDEISECPCDDGFSCVEDMCIENPIQNETNSTNSSSSGGSGSGGSGGSDDLCENISCDEGFICQLGNCVTIDSTICDPLCLDGFSCVDNICIEIPPINNTVNNTNSTIPDNNQTNNQTNTTIPNNNQTDNQTNTTIPNNNQTDNNQTNDNEGDCTENCSTTVECFEDIDCDGGLVCELNECVFECTQDLHCSPGEMCVSNICILIDENECSDDNDCEQGFICNSATCEEEQIVSDACADNTDCSDGEECVIEQGQTLGVCMQIDDSQPTCTDNCDEVPEFGFFGILSIIAMFGYYVKKNHF